jgi:transposase
MQINSLLADPVALRLEQINPAPHLITFLIRAVQPTSNCPRCQQPSARIHSRYTRLVADLPWQGTAVCLKLRVRRFRCSNDLCHRRLFCETLPQVVERYARKSLRLTDALRVLGFAIGGEAGSRVAVRLGMSASPDTLIRRVRQAIRQPPSTPRVLGVDDFAFRRGRRYGTILVDLERHRVIDLLPDREAETLRKWLVEHPGIEFITRDRALAYAEGASLGAPAAVQVADRFHLVKNMSEAIERLLERKQAILRQTAQEVNGGASSAPAVKAAKVNLRRPEREKQQRRERRHARYEEVLRLYDLGCSRRQIARLTRLSRQTVQKYISAGSFPETAHPGVRVSQIDCFADHLRRRWAEGCHQATQLWQEICEQGYTGAYSSFCQYLSSRYKSGAEGNRGRSVGPATSVLSPRRAMWLLVSDDLERKPEEQALLTKLQEVCPEVEKGAKLARSFKEMVRERKSEELEQWMVEAKESGIPEMSSFVGGIERDEAAVRAALTYEWSNGQAEGQVNRLKMIKRSMYGRAKLDLLRQRVLAAA